MYNIENVISKEMADGTVWDFIYGIFYNFSVKSITNGKDNVGTLNSTCVVIG